METETIETVGLEPMTADELEELESARAAHEQFKDYTCEVLKDLKDGQVYWIPGPFATKFWPDSKPVKPKHACPECGAKHVIRNHMTNLSDAA